MPDTLFMICVRFLEWLGKKTKLTYKEISVIFNLWIQGTILLISGILPLLLLIITATYQPILVILSGIILFSNLFLYIWMFVHYKGSMNKIFDQCVYDLQELAMKLHTTYYIVNIVIFIILWILAVSMNITLSYVILRQ